MKDTKEYQKAQRMLAKLVRQADTRQQATHLLGITAILAILTLVVGLLILLSGCMPPVDLTVTEPAFIFPSATSQPTERHPDKRSFTIAVSSPTPQKSCTVSTGYLDGTVNVRSGPGMQYSVVDVANEGEVMPIYGEIVNGWQRTTTPQLVEGWFYIARWCKEGKQ